MQLTWADSRPFYQWIHHNLIKKQNSRNKNTKTDGFKRLQYFWKTVLENMDYSWEGGEVGGGGLLRSMLILNCYFWVYIIRIKIIDSRSDSKVIETS